MADKKTTILALSGAVLVIFVLAGVLLVRKPSKISFFEHLDETAVTVDGQPYTLRAVSFYIAYEEQQVEAQARVYDPDDTNAYWNLHTNGEFVKESARQAVIDMVVHDCVFYGLARENELALTQKELEKLKLAQEDFWMDLSVHQQETLLNQKEDIFSAMERMALAQKQQALTAAFAGEKEDAYGMNGKPYREMLKQHSYKVNTELFKRLDFGNITLTHEGV